MPKHNPRTTSGRPDLLLMLLLLPGIVSALILGAGRYRMEAQNRAVELTLDYAELQNLSVASGTPLPEILRRFRTSGVTGVAITEDLLGDLASTGQVTFESRASDAGVLTVIRVPNRRLGERIRRSLEVRLSPDMLSSGDGSGAFVVRASPGTLSTMGVGLPPDAVNLVQRSGLDVVARLQNHPALTPRAIDAAIDDLRRGGIRRLICAGEEVLGFRGLVTYVADKINEAGLVFGSIEFGKQKGDARMSEELDARLVRVHSVSSAEMATMSPNMVVERFVRAVRERNIRLCYVRLIETSGPDPIGTNLSFVGSIVDGISRAGYSAGQAKPLEDREVNPLLRSLIALSIAAGASLLLGSLMSLSPVARYGLTLVVTAFGVGLAIVGGMGVKLLALASALIFPTLGVMMFVGPRFVSDQREASQASKAVGLFVGMSAMSLVGALFIAGLLAERSFMVKVDQFAGIKVAHLLPLLAVMFFMAAGLPIHGKHPSEVWREVKSNLRRVMSHPLFVWHAVAMVFALLIVGIALIRTGNDPGVGVSSLELKFRSILDKLLVVRPRTKEFLIGHPAMLLGTALLLAGRRAWGLPLVALGVLGQVSLVNTFCHIHTPLSLSIMRAWNGLIVGILFGIIAWAVVCAIAGRAKTKSQATEQSVTGGIA